MKHASKTILRNNETAVLVHATWTLYIWNTNEQGKFTQLTNDK